MALLVHKYGGSSLSSIAHIKQVAAHLASIANAGHKIIAVVSAMGQQTNDFLALVHELSATPPKREVDMLLTVGERVSMALMSIALHNLSIRSISLTGSQSGILTDSNHTNARITRITGERIRQALAEHDVVIVAGFQGVNAESKEITTLGRGGSDLSAVALAAAFQAAVCDIYTDVPGICTADPRIVVNARLLPSVSAHAASELAWAGAKVIHHRAVHIANKFNVPLRKRSSQEITNEGTLISGQGSMESPTFVTITSKEQQSLIQLEDIPDQQSFSKILIFLWENGCAPLQQQLQQSAASTLTGQLLVPKVLVEKIRNLLAHLGLSTSIKLLLDDVSAISVIGEGFWQSPETVAALYATCSAPILFSDVRNSSVLLCVAPAHMNQTIQDLHQKFFEVTK